MKDRALQLVKETPEPQKANLLREYLQAHILYSLQGKRAFEQLAFVDGTALRFIYGIPRFSEDLDFSLERKTGYSLDTLLQAAETDLTEAGFEVSVHPKTGKAVHSAFFRFPGLLYEAGLNTHRTQKLSIKVEIDTNPPPGAKTEQTVINRHFLLELWHHDLPSLMAGKIHALLMRSYTKGRDLYDLLWYLTRSEPVVPNIVLAEQRASTDGLER
ncbi:nucleotidyl transferase AbiEii/AbiGii toxin family protein [Candidatus Bipolaricaulota bacterium]|nr:nucleotidyl transferase AbiEii/AbiGii toxin family protein [Candidatus Bipolaricaulota bacterium]